MKTIQGSSYYEEIIKKSRFIIQANRADSVEDAIKYLGSVKINDASHNCWAYKIGETYRFSDDGEPGGTAGRPIFMAIEQQNFDHVIVVVTRHFGGIKLGTGGLARAYGGTAGKCLQQAVPYIVQNRIIFHLNVPFDTIGLAYPFLNAQPGIRRLAANYTDHGIQFTLQIVEQDYETFRIDALNCSSGTFILEILKKVWK